MTDRGRCYSFNLRFSAVGGGAVAGLISRALGHGHVCRVSQALYDGLFVIDASSFSFLLCSQIDLEFTDGIYKSWLYMEIVYEFQKHFISCDILLGKYSPLYAALSSKTKHRDNATVIVYAIQNIIAF